jgi:peptidoglycan/LPS O-acetylase OafA/YrhL
MQSSAKAAPVVASLAKQGPALSSFKSDSGNLDLIRAVAVLSVFFAHLHDFVAGDHAMLGWHFAQMGVLIFFVHTSMVLMLSLERMRLNGPAMFGAFYIRRFFRLYPLSMFCVTVAMLLHIAPNAQEPFRHWNFTEYLSNLALTTDLTRTKVMVGGLWTLPIEVQMYATLPFLFLLGRSRFRNLLLVLWLVAIPIGMLQVRVTDRLDVLEYSPCFLAGVIAWRISVAKERILPGWLWPIAFVATWPVFFLAKHETEMYFRWAFCITLGLAIPWFSELQFRPLRFAAHQVAKYSYGIYLSHAAIMLWILRSGATPTAKWLMLISAAVVVPVLMYHCIEHPLINVGQGVAKRLFGRGVDTRALQPKQEPQVLAASVAAAD